MLAVAVVAVRHVQELPLEVDRREGSAIFEPDRLAAGQIARHLAVGKDETLERQIPIDAVVKNSKDQTIGLTPVWTSQSPAVATVSSAGIVTSVSKGTAMIVAKVGDVQGACEVSVDTRDISRLELRPQTALVRVGDHQQFAVLAYGPDGVPIEGIAAVFLSTDPAVARVDASGKAQGLGPGASTIRAVLGTTRGEATLIVN